MTHWTPLSPSHLHHLGLGIAYGMTDIGRVRRTNEDNFLIDEQAGLVMVADGMGGHQAGDVASADALKSMHRHLAATPPADDDITIPARLAAVLPQNGTNGTISAQDLPACVSVFNALDFANRRLFMQNAANGYVEGEGMGTTLTGIWQHRPGRIVVFHVGDSRLYRYRAGRLMLLTRDHTLYQHAIDMGAVSDLPPRNLLLQAIGPASTIEPAIHVEEVQSGDLYLLCSDGLHGKVPAEEVARVLAMASIDGIEHCCAKLIALANELDGKDNVTAVLTLCR